MCLWVVRVQSLINNWAEATTALLMQLCTDMGDDSKADGDWVAKVADFAHLYAERCAESTVPWMITCHVGLRHMYHAFHCLAIHRPKSHKLSTADQGILQIVRAIIMYASTVGLDFFLVPSTSTKYR